MTLVSNIPGDLAYLKFVRDPQTSKEAEVLTYLSAIKSPNNHAVKPIAVWKIPSGTYIALPDCGAMLSLYKELAKYLFPLSRQLIQGVLFMHEHGVVHMDLKPDNLFVDKKAKRLVIIDFNIARRVKHKNEVWHGFAGTPKWAAPEVGPGDYKPVLADVWSCGKVINYMCENCPSSNSKDLEFLFGISSRLMNADPEERPSLTEIATLISSYRIAQERSVVPASNNPAKDMSLGDLKSD